MERKGRITETKKKGELRWEEESPEKEKGKQC
jgi:hypothetical protein